MGLPGYQAAMGFAEGFNAAAAQDFAKRVLSRCSVLLYPRSTGLRGMSESRIQEILANVRRALVYMGHQVETWDVETWIDR